MSTPRTNADITDNRAVALERLKAIYPGQVYEACTNAEAVEKLQKAANGTFLIRPAGKDPNAIVLCCKDKDGKITQAEFVCGKDPNQPLSFPSKQVPKDGEKCVTLAESIYGFLHKLEFDVPCVVQPANSSIMVISTQKGIDEESTLGMTGKAIQQTCGAGLVNMHRDVAQPLSPEEQEEFKNHLKPGGLLIITGHGRAGGEAVSGLYQALDDSQSVKEVEVTFSAKEYVDNAMKSSCLKAGDHINVLLYSCYGGERSEDKKSFAEQIGIEFANRGISSAVIASKNPVDRMAGNEYAEQRQQDGLRFGTKNAGDLCVYTTFPGDPQIQFKQDKVPQNFRITKEGFHFEGPKDAKEQIKENVGHILKSKSLKEVDSFLGTLKMDESRENSATEYAKSINFIIKRSMGQDESGKQDKTRIKQVREYAKDLLSQLPVEDRRAVLFKLKDMDGGKELAEKLIAKPRIYHVARSLTSISRDEAAERSLEPQTKTRKP